MMHNHGGCVCVCALLLHTYAYANDIGQCHYVAKYREIVVAEDHLESLQGWRVVLRKRRMLGGTHTHKPKNEEHAVTVKLTL